ncbi:hypothetical protein [Longimicrobium sp.]|uniref:hypothetical protein n=1 Tax=Longimicrobium sp. TaxID=2029185 RepID=UPI002F95273F
MRSEAGCDPDALIAILAGDEPRASLQAEAEVRGVFLPELYNGLALEVARRFLDGRMHFDDADELANTLSAMMISDAADHGDGFVLPQPAWSIYEAFDAGEWNRGEPDDPVERYTRPLLEALLADPQSSTTHGVGGAGR